MNHYFPNMFKPIQIGTVTVPNRFVVPPMGNNFANPDGSMSDRSAAYYEARAKGGFGLITLESTVVYKEAKGGPRKPCLFDDAVIPSFKAVADRCHAYGAKVSIQLQHAGPEGNSKLTGYPLKAASAIAPSAGREIPEAMPTEEVYKLIECYGDAARRAQLAGIDMVEVHCAHGYLLSQFLDPNTNHRTDEFGGSAENRFRFAGECLSAIRQAVGKDYPILVKVNTNCAGEADAAYAQDILYFCRQFEALGADAIELSGYNWLGLGKKKVPTFYLDRAVQIRQAVSIPLILVGGVRGPETAQQILDAGIDFVSASRPFICQPDFVRHLEQGEDSPCVGCTKCLGNIWSKEGRRCIKHEIPAAFANNQA